MDRYIHERKDWPNFRWDSRQLIPLIGQVRNLQGKLIGKMESVGFDLRDEANLETVTVEIVKSSEIEGEVLNAEQVRSSLARRLGMERAGLVPSNRDVDGMVDLLLDAIQNYQSQLTKDRLFDWHFSLFPTGRSGMYKIIVGNWRDDSTGPMQVVSGAMGKERVHFQAPSAERIPEEVDQFLTWVNVEQKDLDPVLKAGIAHLWFVTIHPFEDGNGRITRAITDMLLTRSDGIPQRFYSMSAQIRNERKQYYDILESTQSDDLDITPWLLWFLRCLHNALLSSAIILQKVMYKHRFWLKHADKPLNERQRKMLNRLLDDFKGKLTTRKWGKMTKSSHDTALRDIQGLIGMDILKKEKAGGRSTNYGLVEINDQEEESQNWPKGK
ncbi:MAG: Fic family protein [Saprospiraceae bacterium]